MDERERLAWLGLCWGADIGPAGFARLMAIYGTATAVLDAEEADLVLGEARLKEGQAAAVRQVRHRLDSYAELAAQVRANGTRVHFSPDEGYPETLRELPHPPPVVCVKGQLLPADMLAVGIVGTRSPSREGADLAEKLAAAAAADEFTVVSGLARGIDTAAHLGALNREGRTIAIIGSGIANITPPENEELAARIGGASGTSAPMRPAGAVISELSPVAPPTIPNLMARNRLISLFSRGVIVVECRATGGSLATAQAALHQGRRLYAVQWPEQDELREGCAHLISQGAETIAGPQDMRRVGLELRAWGPPANDADEPAEKAQLSLF
ncbi:MAG: DNA-protecting protein DprA [Armatimonadetes bacterium]|nr:DNA-protecting protein DprA [Armatimonadota bacterium]